MYKISVSLLMPWLFITMTACSYKGAVYADYTQTGIGVRAAPETTTPAEIHFGYDRGVFASVPKKTGDMGKGEAVAIISKNNVYAKKLNDTSTEEIRVDAAFLTGMAAQVAGLPKDAVVDVSSQPGLTRVSGPIKVEGSMGDRINPLFKPTHRFTTPQQRTLQELYDHINARDEKDQVYDQAAKKLSPEFLEKYNEAKGKNVTNAEAFKSAGIDYFTAGDAAERQQELIQALQSALANQPQ